MLPESRADRWFVARVTLLVGVPFSLFFIWAYMGGDREKWLFLVICILVTFLVSFVIAFGVWFFLVRPKQEAEQGIAQRSGRSGELESSDAIEYAAHYSEIDTRASERAFVRRGLRELWLWEIVLGPASAFFALAVGHAVGAGTWFIVAFGALGCFLIGVPALLLIARPALAAAGARRLPTEVVAFRPEGLVFRGNAHERLYAWHRIRRVWHVGPHYVLVADRHLGIHLPKDGLPAGALDYVRSHAALSDR